MTNEHKTRHTESRYASRDKMRDKHPEHAMLTVVEVEGLLGITRRLFYKMEAEGTFPNRINLAHRTVLYRLKDIQEWIEARSSEARAAADAPLSDVGGAS